MLVHALVQRATVATAATLQYQYTALVNIILVLRRAPVVLYCTVLPVLWFLFLLVVSCGLFVLAASFLVCCLLVLGWCGGGVLGVGGAERRSGGSTWWYFEVVVRCTCLYCS